MFNLIEVPAGRRAAAGRHAAGEVVRKREHGSRTPKRLTREEKEGIAEADIGTRGRVGEPAGEVEIDLVVRRQLVGRAHVEELAGAATFGEIASIFDEGVPGLG